MADSLERQALKRIGKNWSKASQTREKLLGNIRHFSRFLRDSYHLERIENIKPRMIQEYVAAMEKKGLSSSTRANRMTAVREVCRAVGKQGICARENIEYGIQRVRVNPQAVNESKLKEIRSALSERAATGDHVAKMMIAADKLREAFGLRAKESLMTSTVVEKDGKEYLSVEGAKGGRPRLLSIDNDRKAEAVKFALETSKCLGSGTGRILPPELTLQQAYDAQRYEWRQLGGTRENNANMHSERHSFARLMAKDGATKAEIMTELGHGEARSPAAYGV